MKQICMNNQTLEELLEKIEEHYLGHIAEYLYQTETEYISHDEVKRLLANEAK